MALAEAGASTSVAGDLTISARTVQSLAVNKIREAILSGIFAPGQRIREAELCQRLGVSRTSVREALRSLEAERLVTIIPNKGPVITELSWEAAEQIYNVRALLEGEAAALMAQRRNPEDVEKMRAALLSFDAAVSRNSLPDQIAATGEFYKTILNGCGNEIIAQIIDGLLARINMLRSKSMSMSGRSRFSAMEMWSIFEAISAGNVDEARTLAEEHVKSAKNSARRYMDGLQKTSA
ncbi:MULTISPECIES: GntR family transcriptional regulator [unclassified Chelatococcus]|uniref:GntR family transcriptional regulator n=1 Tax=unclassified Chelatococcus TaxID=2638111 RepID=UPI001BD0A3CC|nr:MULTISPECIES: GntR family transcriptional regulator [unclassified Chelatococcus]MBS7700452.1 GntR family transcriptional regulator [Chelatococcus sp. YT9]MBX3556248.1 GntR family transcriptional regulator [Chelatococcus sp.]